MSDFVSSTPEENTVVDLVNTMVDVDIEAGTSINAAPYDTSEQPVVYSNDFEYRAWIRRLMCMIPAQTIDDDIDEVSRDEMMFDETASEKALQYVYDKTQHHPLFKELYILGAGTMFSTDPSFGIAVLFSYDYLALFHPCVCCFFNRPYDFTDTFAPYVSLRKKLV